MHKIVTHFFLVITLLLVPDRGAWAQGFEWARRIAARPDVADEAGKRWKSANIGTYAIETDRQGNVYVAGYAFDSARIEVSPDNYLEMPGKGLFVVKYDTSGKVIWKMDIGGRSSYKEGNLGRITKMAVSDQGDFWITGDLYGTDPVMQGKTRRIQLTSKDEYEVGFVARYDRNGELQWASSFQHGWTYGTDLKPDAAGNLYLAGYFGQGGAQLDEKTHLTWGLAISNIFVAKYDPAGTVLWARPGNTGHSASNMNFYHLGLDAAGNVYVAGDFYGNAYGTSASFTKNAQGEVAKIEVTSSSGIFLVKYSPLGVLAWAKPVGMGGGGYLPGTSEYNRATVSDLATDYTGNGVYLSGFHASAATFDKGKTTEMSLPPGQVYIAKMNSSGNMVWLKGIESNKDGYGCLLKINRSNTVYAAGTYIDAVTFNKGLSNQFRMLSNRPAYFRYYLAKFDSKGNFGWATEPKSDSALYFTDFAASDAGRVHIAGYYSGKMQFDRHTLEQPPVSGQYFYGANYLASAVDTLHHFDVNVIRGNVYEDAGAGSPGARLPAEGMVVKAEPGPYYASTDGLGNYSLYVDKGTYTVSQLHPPDLRGMQRQQTHPAAPGTYSVTFNAYGKDTAGFDFGNQVMRLPFLKVNVAADRRRRCFRGTTTVRYCNEGYAAAQNVQVRVYYPGYVVPISAGMAWQQQDSLLTFNVGTLAPGACGVISIADSVICGNEAIRGLTQCVKAVISPGNNNPPPDPRWDQSDVALKAACRNNGLVKLTILNTGTGNMTAAAAYRIYLDAVKVHEGPYQLASGDSLLLQVPANGRTVRLEADLSAYHPDGARKPSITLEGCGGAGPASISKGFVNQLPPDDAQDEVAVSCLPILDSYDPNDKQATPAGVGPQHLIAPDQPLEYLVRFQNTGSDVAYTVTIADTLDANLDVATLEIGAASHPFSWSVGGVGLPVLTWTFKDINLPDSTTNEPASHGYVRFRIRPKAGIPLGATIRNGAAITFDYNSPVLTNLVTHTTGTLPETVGETVVNVCSGNSPTPARAGQNVVLPEASAVALQGNVPGKGFGYWQLKSGKGKLANPTDPASLVTELGVGKNVFAWNIALCDTTSTSLVTIERVVVPAPPLVNPPAPYCAEEPVAAVTATGVDLRWYADRTLAKQLGTGPGYQPVTGRTDTLYVTQTVEGYQSLPAAVRIAVKPPVPAPRVDTAGYLCNGTLLQPIHAEGATIRWYADAAQTTLLHEGSTFGLSNPGTRTLYVTQAVNGCRSEAAAVTLHAGAGDLKGAVLMPNVITPNGDGYNDAFLPPVFAPGACIGSFRTIRVYNRWGKVVFSSTDPHFAWRAEGCPGGMYFYEIRYSNFSLRGGLSILY